MKAAFNQEKALVGAFSVIVQLVVEPMDRFAALVLPGPGCGEQWPGHQVTSYPTLNPGKIWGRQNTAQHSNSIPHNTGVVVLVQS